MPSFFSSRANDHSPASVSVEPSCSTARSTASANRNFCTLRTDTPVASSLIACRLDGSNLFFIYPPRGARRPHVSLVLKQHIDLIRDLPFGSSPTTAWTCFEIFFLLHGFASPYTSLSM